MKYVFKRLNRGSGIVIAGAAGENLGSKKLVYMTSSGSWKLADAASATTTPAIGITMEPIRSGMAGNILTKGYIGRADWTWNTGERIYISEITAGELTQTAPPNPIYIIQEIGIAAGSKLIWFSPRQVVGIAGALITKTVSIGADELGKPAANNPTVVDKDNVTLYSFAVDTDFMTYKLPVPSDYATGGLKFKAVWTNDGGADDDGDNVKVQFDYQTATEGDAIDGSHANSPKNVNDAYVSATGWLERHTDYVTIAEADFTGKQCVYVKASFVTAPATAMTCEPHLIGICLQYTAYAFA